MRAVTSSRGEISVIDKDAPEGPGELVSVRRAGICGSDLHLVAAGLHGVVLGHEFAGTLDDGSLVAVRPTGECGSCTSCIGGHPNTCRMAAGVLHGTSIDGGLADFVRVEQSRLVALPANMTDSSAALVEPMAVAIHGMSRVDISPGMRVLVVGAGSIGLLTAAALVARGADVSIVARHPHQATVAEALGARVVTSPDNDHDVAFDAVSTQESLDACVTHTRPRGVIVEFGLIWRPVALTNTMLMKEITLVPTMFYSHGHDHDDFSTAAALLHAHPHVAELLVTHSFPLEDAAEAFRVAADRSTGAIKVHLFTNH